GARDQVGDGRRPVAASPYQPILVLVRTRRLDAGQPQRREPVDRAVAERNPAELAMAAPDLVRLVTGHHAFRHTRHAAPRLRIDRPGGRIAEQLGANRRVDAVCTDEHVANLAHARAVAAADLRLDLAVALTETREGGAERERRWTKLLAEQLHQLRPVQREQLTAI